MGNGKINWLQRFKGGDPVRKTAGATHQNRISNILNDMRGVGCRVVKPTNAEGRNWKIIVDGSSDEELPEGYVDPFASSIPRWDQVLDAATDTDMQSDTDDTDDLTIGVFNQRWSTIESYSYERTVFAAGANGLPLFDNFVSIGSFGGADGVWAYSDSGDIKLETGSSTGGDITLDAGSDVIVVGLTTSATPAGALYTQTATQIAAGGATKVVCVV
jgi:hypothetical protein